jgi:hypothetical protein
MSKFYSALELLWDKSADRLTREELERFANLDDDAALQASNIADILDNIAGLVANDGEYGAFQDKDSVSTLCWSLCYQLRQLPALITISGEARYKLNNVSVTDKVEVDVQKRKERKTSSEAH